MTQNKDKKANAPKDEQAPSKEITDGSGLDASLNDDAAMEEMAAKEAELAARKKKLEDETKELEAREKELADREAKVAQGIVSVEVSVESETETDISTELSVVDKLTGGQKAPESLDPKECPDGMTPMKTADNRRIPTLGGHVYRFYANKVQFVSDENVPHCKKYGATVVA